MWGEACVTERNHVQFFFPVSSRKASAIMAKKKQGPGNLPYICWQQHFVKYLLPVVMACTRAEDIEVIEWKEQEQLWRDVSVLCQREELFDKEETNAVW